VATKHPLEWIEDREAIHGLFSFTSPDFQNHLPRPPIFLEEEEKEEEESV